MELERPCFSLDAIAEELAGPAGWNATCGGGVGVIAYLSPSDIEFVIYALEGDRWAERGVRYLDELEPGVLTAALSSAGASPELARRLCTSLEFIELADRC